MKNSSGKLQFELKKRISKFISNNPHLLEDKILLEQLLAKQIKQVFNNNQKTQDKEITILVSDIRGFSSLSEQFKGIEVVTMLNNYFLHMNKVIANYGGIIDKYMGDSIMVLFGFPTQKDDDAKRAIACAVEMQIAMNKVNKDNIKSGFPELFMGIGINTGLVSSGLIGSDLHHEFTVIGNGVNLASRIESHSLRGQILISENTHSIVKKQVQIGNTNKVRIKGRTDFIKLYEVLSINWLTTLKVPKREIRSSPRISIDTEFLYQLLDGKKILPTQHIGRIKDMSYYGLLVILDFKLELLTNIKLSLALSILGERKNIYAKIMSVRNIDGGYGCGLEYTSLDETSEVAIKDYIDRIIE